MQTQTRGMQNGSSDQSIGELTNRLSEGLSELVRKEAELAKGVLGFVGVMRLRQAAPRCRWRRSIQ